MLLISSRDRHWRNVTIFMLCSSIFSQSFPQLKLCQQKSIAGSRSLLILVKSATGDRSPFEGRATVSTSAHIDFERDPENPGRTHADPGRAYVSIKPTSQLFDRPSIHSFQTQPRQSVSESNAPPRCSHFDPCKRE